MSFTIATISSLVRRTLAQNDIICTFPITFSKTMGRTLGSVFAPAIHPEDIREMKFSYSLLTHPKDEAVRQVVLHECAHVIVMVKMREWNGHGELFQKVCKEIGCTGSGKESDEIFASRYEVHCPGCGRVVMQRDKKGNWYNDILRGRYNCNFCKMDSEKFQIVKNW